MLHTKSQFPAQWLCTVILAMGLGGCSDDPPMMDEAIVESKGKKAGSDPVTFAPPPGREGIEEKLRSIRLLDELAFENTSLQEAIKHLDELSREMDANGQGVKLRFEFNNPRIPIDYEIGGNITVGREGISLYDALRFVTSLGECSFKITPEHVLIIPASSVDDQTMFTRSFVEIPNEIGASEADAEEYLKRSGITFSEGASATLDSVGGKLFLHNRRQEHLMVELLFEQLGAQPAIEKRRENLAVQRIEEKLKLIILPSVDFLETPLDEALAILEEMSALHDDGAVSSDTNGIHISRDKSWERPGNPENTGIDAFGFYSGLPSGIGSTPITLRLSNVPLSVALRYTTSLAQMKYRVDSDGVWATPLVSHATPIETQTFRIRPDFLSSGVSDFQEPVDLFFNNSKAQQSNMRLNPASSILQTMGISFSPYESVLFNENDSLLIVRAEVHKLELVEAAVRKLNKNASDEWLENETNRTLSKTSSIILPKTDFESAPLEYVLDFLEVRSREEDSATRLWDKGLDIELRVSSEYPIDLNPIDPFTPSPEHEAALDAYRRVQKLLKEMPVSIHRSNASVAEIISTICEDSGLECFIEGTRVVVTD